MFRKWAGGIAAALALAGCGGGGGDSSSPDQTLYVSMNYPARAIWLFESAEMTPQIDGLQGRTPSCSLVSGTLPAGLQLRNDCAIVGRAMSPALNVITIRLAATGVSNTVDFPLAVQVNAPSVWYPDTLGLPRVAIGTTLSHAPEILSWNAGADVTATWTFNVHSGSLPPGLALDPATGHVNGTVQSSGVHNASIQPVLHTQFGTYAVPNFPGYSLNVDVPALVYRVGGMDPVAYVSQAASIAPALFGGPLPGSVITGAVVAGLPAGLSADDAGVVTGVPTAMPSRGQYHVQATLTHGGASAPTQGTLSLLVDSPVRYYHPPVIATRNTAINHAPTLYQNSPTPLSSGATVVFTPTPGFCRLPAGTSIDTSTGTLSGTPTEAGYFPCPMNVDITNNGVSWTMPVDISIEVW